MQNYLKRKKVYLKTLSIAYFMCSWVHTACTASLWSSFESELCVPVLVCGHYDASHLTTSDAGHMLEHLWFTGVSTVMLFAKSPNSLLPCSCSSTAARQAQIRTSVVPKLMTELMTPLLFVEISTDVKPVILAKWNDHWSLYSGGAQKPKAHLWWMMLSSVTLLLLASCHLCTAVVAHTNSAKCLFRFDHYMPTVYDYVK